MAGPSKRRLLDNIALTADKRRRLLQAARASVLGVEFYEKAGDVYHLIAAMDEVQPLSQFPLAAHGGPCLLIAGWRAQLWRGRGSLLHGRHDVQCIAKVSAWTAGDGPCGRATVRLGAAATSACRAQADTVHLQVRPYDPQLYLHCFTEFCEDGKCPAKSRVLFGFHWPALQLEEATSHTKLIRPIRKRRSGGGGGGGGGAGGRRGDLSPALSPRPPDSAGAGRSMLSCRSAFLILKDDLSGTHQSPAFRYRRFMQRVPGLGALAESLLAGRLAAALERASAFVLVHEDAARDLRRLAVTVAVRCLRHSTLQSDLPQ